jgi:hypothetical protein
MRILVILILLLSIASSGQNKLTPNVATEFVHQKMNGLNILLWNAVHFGEITAYRNDSLKSKINSNEIYKQTQLETTVWIVNPSNPDDPYDLISQDFLFEFDSSSQFEGVNLHYTKVVKGKKVSFKLVSIAPLWKPVTESGIDLGLQPLFHVKIKDVKKLKGIDYSFYEALFATRASVGDFVNPYFAPFENEEQLGQDITYNNLSHSPHYINFSDFQYSVVGHHLAYLPILTAIEGEQKGLRFFKDADMKLAFVDVQSELQDTAMVMVPNPDSPDDPYDLIAVQLFELFDFSQIHDVAIDKKEKDLIFKLSRPCLMSRVLNIYDKDCKQYIYYSYNTSKKNDPKNGLHSFRGTPSRDYGVTTFQSPLLPHACSFDGLVLSHLELLVSLVHNPLW